MILLNKLTMNTRKLSQNISILEVKEKESVFIIQKPIIVEKIIFQAQDFVTTWKIEENAAFDCGCLLELKDCNGKIVIESSNKTKLILHLGIEAKGKNQLTIENILNGSENNSEIVVRMVGDSDSYTTLKTTGVLKKDTKENIFLEEVKYLNENDNFIECIPELLVDSNDVTANHNVSIGNISKEDLFYLESKGIEENVARDLIRKCFINSMIRNSKREEDENEY